QELWVDHLEAQAAADVLVKFFRQRPQHQPFALNLGVQYAVADRKGNKFINAVIQHHRSKLRHTRKLRFLQGGKHDLVIDEPVCVDVKDVENPQLHFLQAVFVLLNTGADHLALQRWLETMPLTNDAKFRFEVQFPGQLDQDVGVVGFVHPQVSAADAELSIA